MVGCSTRKAVEENLDTLFGEQSSEKQFKDSCCWYKPRLNFNDRFELVLSTPEQQQCAWQYGHQNLILLHGTFGVSDCRILLFILMVLDQENHGIPICFLLFSPPGGSVRTSSNYDHSIIKKLI